MKLARQSFGKDYECKQAWEKTTGVQCGGKGLVFGEKENYTTAFFEAFPKSPSCFIRGEGKDIEEAELNAWNKYQKILSCNHEMERRNRTDGYGYCKHCSYSSMVFEPLTKCCKCKVPTAYTQDYRKNWYCKKHSINKPINPNSTKFDKWTGDCKKERIPRKLKKLLKKAVIFKFESEGIFGKVTYKYSLGPIFKCKNYSWTPLFNKSIKKVIQNYKK